MVWRGYMYELLWFTTNDNMKWVLPGNCKLKCLHPIHAFLFSNSHLSYLLLFNRPISSACSNNLLSN